MKPKISTKDSPSVDALSQAQMNWKQVLTSGFPTYRACSQFVEDAGTGKIYLFSGFFEREFLPDGMPSDMHIKCFVDLWELRLNMPGGNFEGVDVEEEARTARKGPWKRCFTCCAVGYLDYKCAGMCYLIDFQDGSNFSGCMFQVAAVAVPVFAIRVVKRKVGRSTKWFTDVTKFNGTWSCQWNCKQR